MATGCRFSALLNKTHSMPVLGGKNLHTHTPLVLATAKLSQWPSVTLRGSMATGRRFSALLSETRRVPGPDGL